MPEKYIYFVSYCHQPTLYNVELNKPIFENAIFSHTTVETDFIVQTEKDVLELLNSLCQKIQHGPVSIINFILL